MSTLVVAEKPADVPPRRRRRWPWLVATALLMPVVAWLTWWSWAAWELDAAQRAAAAAGVPTSLTDWQRLYPQEIPAPEDDAWPIYQQEMGALATRLATVPVPEILFAEQSQPTSATEAIRLWSSQRRWEEADPSQRLALIHLTESPIARDALATLARLAARRSCRNPVMPPTDPTSPASRKNPWDRRHLAYLARLQARVQVANGAADDAAATIRNGLRLAQHQLDSPDLLSLLFAVSIASVATNSIDSDLLAQANATSLLALRDDLISLDWWSELHRIQMYDANRTADWFYAGGYTKLRQMLALTLNTAEPFPQTATRETAWWFYASPLGRPARIDDQTRFIAHLRRWNDLFVAGKPSPGAMADYQRSVSDADPSGLHPLSRFLWSASGFLVKTMQEWDVRRSAMILAIDCRRHVLLHGAFPAVISPPDDSVEIQRSSETIIIHCDPYQTQDGRCAYRQQWRISLAIPTP